MEYIAEKHVYDKGKIVHLKGEKIKKEEFKRENIEYFLRKEIIKPFKEMRRKKDVMQNDK